MKKVFSVIFTACLMVLGNYVYAQNLTPEKQEIINRQRAEIQQKRNSANEWQAKADEAGRKCQYYKNAKDPGEDVKTITLMISKYCGDQEIYQKKADELRKEADKQEKLLNEAIEQAKRNSKE